MIVLVLAQLDLIYATGRGPSPAALRLLGTPPVGGSVGVVFRYDVPIIAELQTHVSLSVLDQLEASGVPDARFQLWLGRYLRTA